MQVLFTAYCCILLDLITILIYNQSTKNEISSSKTKALQSLKMSGTTHPTTQCPIPEDPHCITLANEQEDSLQHRGSLLTYTIKFLLQKLGKTEPPAGVASNRLYCTSLVMNKHEAPVGYVTETD